MKRLIVIAVLLLPTVAYARTYSNVDVEYMKEANQWDDSVVTNERMVQWLTDRGETTKTQLDMVGKWPKEPVMVIQVKPKRVKKPVMSKLIPSVDKQLYWENPPEVRRVERAKLVGPSMGLSSQVIRVRQHHPLSHVKPWKPGMITTTEETA